MTNLSRPVPGVKFDSADRKALRRMRNSFFGCSPDFMFDMTAAEAQAVDAICRGVLPRDVALKLDAMVAD